MRCERALDHSMFPRYRTVLSLSRSQPLGGGREQEEGRTITG